MPGLLRGHRGRIPTPSGGSGPYEPQSRFYAAADETGQPVERAAPKNDGYAPGTGLRGRKAYWHRSTTPNGYWTPGPAAAGGRFREWQPPEGQAIPDLYAPRVGPSRR